MGKVRKIVIREGDAPKLMTRVVGPRNTPLTQSLVSSISWKLFDLRSPTARTSIDDGTLDPEDVIFNSLQTPSIDAAWEEDEIGYNFAHQWPSSQFLRDGGGGGLFRLEVKGVPATGEEFWIGVWDIQVIETLT